MKTIIYISRHSQPFRDLLGEYNANEVEQLRNEKNPLSGEGERKAKILSEVEELSSVKNIYSSHYVRAMCTAKYIAENNNIRLNVDERFGERKFGIKDWSEFPKDFFEHQFRDWDYKLPNGESLNEVTNRMYEAFMEVLSKVNGETTMIVAHGTSLTTLLSKWCDIKLNEETKLIEIYFKNELIFNGNWQAPELFELVFEGNDLVNIKNISIQY